MNLGLEINNLAVYLSSALVSSPPYSLSCSFMGLKLLDFI